MAIHFKCIFHFCTAKLLKSMRSVLSDFQIGEMLIFKKLNLVILESLIGGWSLKLTSKRPAQLIISIKLKKGSTVIE